MSVDELRELIRDVYRDTLDAMEPGDRNALLEDLAAKQQERRPDRAASLRSLMILPNGNIIRRGAPLPMPVVPRDRVDPPGSRRPKPLAVRLYDRAIGPQPRVTLPYAVEALLKIEAPPPCIEIVERVVERQEPVDAPPLVTVREIIKVVRQAYDLDATDFMSDRRFRGTVRARQVAMWLAKKHTRMSLPQIGLQMDRRDHTTVLHGIRKIDAILAADTEEADEIRFVIARCRIALGLPHDPD